MTRAPCQGSLLSVDDLVRDPLWQEVRNCWLVLGNKDYFSSPEWRQLEGHFVAPYDTKTNVAVLDRLSGSIGAFDAVLDALANVRHHGGLAVAHGFIEKFPPA